MNDKDIQTLAMLTLLMTAGGFLMMIGNGFGFLVSLGAVPFIMIAAMVGLYLIRRFTGGGV